MGLEESGAWFPSSSRDGTERPAAPVGSPLPRLWLTHWGNSAYLSAHPDGQAPE